ncbi:hypothetical protein L7F22_063563 [Adiantum nelumboides]|nr:hypothetical protein [Adiantum nelumboides]
MEDQQQLLLTIILAIVIVGQQALQSCEGMLARAPETEDDSSIDIAMCSMPLILAGSTVSPRPRYAGGTLAPEHGWYVKPRSTIHWWNHFVFHASADDERWREMFRLPYQLFTSLVQLVRDDINQKPIPEPLSYIPGCIWTAEKKIAGRKLCWPETTCELAQVKDGFRALRGLPNCCGAVDATHINMNLPKNETNKSWFDRNGNYSMLAQGIVDAIMRFLDVNIGWPGSCNDKRVLWNSSFYKLYQGRERSAGPTFVHEDLSI